MDLPDWGAFELFSARVSRISNRYSKAMPSGFHRRNSQMFHKSPPRCGLGLLKTETSQVVDADDWDRTISLYQIVDDPSHKHDSMNVAMSLSTDEQHDLVKESLLYKEFLAEREEILRHKWIESEKVGHDIGFEKALLDWIVKHRSAWRSKRQQELQRNN